MKTDMKIATGNPELDNKIKEWLLWDQNEATVDELCKLLATEKYDDLGKLLFKRLNFGTAGIRGKMCFGYAAMNDLVIIQTTQGLCKYLENTNQFKNYEGVIIGFDGRHNSKRFAELCATIFLNANHKVRLFRDMVPTPFIPFAVTKYKCAIGIMITASHNPKEDNGYKVYGSNGAQIISPTDKLIQEQILKNLKPLKSSWDTSILKKSKLICDPFDEVLKDYLSMIKDSILPKYEQINLENKILFIYTPMHGVGYNFIKKSFECINIKFVAVEEQKDPDPEFSTVKYPNPEEGKSCLNLALATAENMGSRIIIANDPDADRMACAEKDLETNTWKIFNGNELGALLGWWLLHCYKEANPDVPLTDVYMLSSTVSSMILKTMANKEGFNFIDTLTGFKWIGNKSIELMAENKKVIFAFEEAIGFMCGSAVLDKDGISAACQIATLASFLYQNNLTLNKKLEELYNTYGYHITKNSYYICNEPETIKKIFDRIRNYQGENKYPTGILGNKYQINGVRDLTTGYDSNQINNEAILPISQSNQMITFNFDNGLICTLRTSGTEPKIKYYTEICGKPKEKNSKNTENTLTEMINGIIEEFLQPTLHKLQPQTN